MTWRTSCVGLKGSRDGRRSERRRKNKIIHHVKIELPRAAPAALIPRKIKYQRRKGGKKDIRHSIPCLQPPSGP